MIIRYWRFLIKHSDWFNIFSVVYAQPSFPNEPTQTPIGGLGVLAAAGGAMVVKKIINNRKKWDLYSFFISNNIYNEIE